MAGPFACRKNYNPNYKSVGNQYYDHVPDKIGETTGKEILRAQAAKFLSSISKFPHASPQARCRMWDDDVILGPEGTLA